MGVPQEQKVTSTRPVTERRRIRKPIMDKKRRDRINICLDEISTLLREEEFGKAAKLENADILEQTVKCWQDVRGLQGDAMMDALPEESSYITGYKQCIQVVDDLLRTCQETDTEGLRQGLLQHLSSCVQELAKPTAVSEIGNDTQDTKTAPAHASGSGSGNRPPSSAPPLRPNPSPLLQEGHGGKQSPIKDTKRSGEPDGPSSATSNELRRKCMGSQQFIRVKDTGEHLSSLLPRTGGAALRQVVEQTASPTNDTTDFPSQSEIKKAVSPCSLGRETPDAKKDPEEYLMIIEEEEEMEEGETAMEFLTDRVWRPW